MFFVCREAVLKNDAVVVIRPVRPEDEPLLAAFHRGLSDRSVYQRYFHMMKLGHRIGHERLARICASDGTDDAVLVMEKRGDPGATEIVGVARLTPVEGTADAEFAVLVTDREQGVGAGTALMRGLIDLARARGVARLQADILTDNVDMQRMCAQLGITIRPTADPGLVRAELGIYDPDDQKARNTASDRPVTS